MTKLTAAAGCYEVVAHEYYDPLLHPTCANFSELSGDFIKPRVHLFAQSKGNILELGAGRSVVGPVLDTMGLPLTRLTLVDSSPSMLDYSRLWQEKGAKLLVRNAGSSGLDDSDFGLIVCSLGDPYDDEAFWGEISRLMHPNGVCLFTTPAWEWASRFRATSKHSFAEFLLNDGRVIEVPSYVREPDAELKLIKRAGLTAEEVVPIPSDTIRGSVSPKLLVGSPGDPVLRGFVVSKR